MSSKQRYGGYVGDSLPAISVCLFGPGTVWTNEPAALTGTVVAECWAGSGSLSIVP